MHHQQELFDEEKVFKEISTSEVVQGKEKKKKKRVSFNTQLIKGPSNINTDEGIGYVHGGEASDPDISESGSSDTESQEDEVEQENSEDLNLDDYILARDRQRREIRPPSRFEDTNFMAYALASAEDIDQDEPSSYFEATKSRD